MEEFKTFSDFQKCPPTFQLFSLSLFSLHSQPPHPSPQWEKNLWRVGTPLCKLFARFLPVLSKLSQVSLVKIFHFLDEWKMVSVAPQRRVYTPLNLEVYFSDIMVTASRLNTFCGLETLYVHSSRHYRIINKVLRHLRYL